MSSPESKLREVRISRPSATTIEFEGSADLERDLVEDRTENPTIESTTQSEVPIMEDLDKCVKSDTDEVEVMKSVVVNREFERAYGFSQSDIREMHHKFGNLAIWKLLAPTQELTLAAEEYQSKKTNAAKAVFDDVKNRLAHEVRRVFMAHHLCIINGQSQFSLTVNFNTKHGVSIKTQMLGRALLTADTMVAAWSYYFIPLTST